ncbi:hypothetical protein JR316_0008653 [Psilocybe cubensis]|uniref:Uncharacterized protein n=1 Tax=Psilocybe cubensis TaxID=181762 RepID=A0ACB8GRV1_PSICU|nr:hypothetical protein JR316_0008653 [Psilocybe cubensis]KAH9478200.1 hypothetical protein JR316_0008653 [Psilocybe cubensis]
MDMDPFQLPPTSPSVEELMHEVQLLTQELNFLRQQQQSSSTPPHPQQPVSQSPSLPPPPPPPAALDIHSFPTPHVAPSCSHSVIKVSPPDPFDGSMEKAENFLRDTAGKWAYEKTKVIDNA